MKRILLVLAIALPVVFQAQLKVIYPNGTENLNGTTVQTVPEQADEKRILWMVNETDEELSLHCRRTELDVVPATTNNICWVICPAIPQIAGENPIWTVGLGENLLTETAAPGDTIRSFDFIYDPEGQPGCSEFLVEIIDSEDDNIVYASFNVVSSECPLSTEELSSPVELVLSPNPATDRVQITIDNALTEGDIHIMDVLGRTIQVHPGTVLTDGVELLDVSALNEGLYFLSLVNDAEILSTKRFIINR